MFPLLDKFAERHPESVFDASAPLLLANAFIQQKNGVAAVKVLEPMLGTPESEHAEFKYALGRAYQVGGDTTKAAAGVSRGVCAGSRWRMRLRAGADAVDGNGDDADGGRSAS